MSHGGRLAALYHVLLVLFVNLTIHPWSFPHIFLALTETIKRSIYCLYRNGTYSKRNSCCWSSARCLQGSPRWLSCVLDCTAEPTSGCRGCWCCVVSCRRRCVELDAVDDVPTLVDVRPPARSDLAVCSRHNICLKVSPSSGIAKRSIFTIICLTDYHSAVLLTSMVIEELSWSFIIVVPHTWQKNK